VPIDSLVATLSAHVSILILIPTHRHNNDGISSESIGDALSSPIPNNYTLPVSATVQRAGWHAFLDDVDVWLLPVNFRNKSVL